MSDLKEIVDAVVQFRDERDWKQFHNPKDLAIAINVEAGELLELFLWKQSEEVNTEKLKEELADVLAFALLLANEKGFDIKELILNKLKLNAAKYPIDKAKGNAKKYTDL
jgi:NTP pyrophosphatase (non-canonical NTP hydrolase)